MATDIGPKIGIDGARDFKQALSEINSTLRTSKTEMDAVTSAYDKNDKSAEKLTKENEALAKQLEKLREAQTKAAEAVEFAKDKFTENHNETRKAQQAYNKTTTEINNLQRQLDENNKTLESASNATEETAESLDDMADAAGKDTQALDALAGALAAAGVIAGLKKITEALKEAVDASVEFESAITGVYKTVDGTESQLQAISDGIKQLSTVIPATTTELAAVAESAGQLGIATDDVLKFTEVMTNLGVTTNLSAEEAASALAKFVNVTGMSSENYERLGSTIVALGNNFATTEADIVQMATRLSSAGTLAGLTESEILALATAMSSVGVQAEAGGTAMTQTLTAIEKAVAKGGKELSQFAKVAGMSADEFSNTWENDALGAVQAFISGLGELEAQGDSATLVLDEMGLSGIRQSNTLKALALASDKLASAVNLSSTAWQENSALMDEANLRYGTTESKFMLLENSVGLLKQAVGDALTPALGELAETGADVTQWAAEFIADNKEIVQVVTALIATLGVLIGGATGIGALLVLLPKLKAAIDTIKIALAFSGTATAIGLALTAVAALATGIIALAASSDSASKRIRSLEKDVKESSKAFEETASSIKAQADSVGALIASLERLSSVEGKTAAQKVEMQAAVSELNEAIPSLALAYDDEADALTRAGEAAQITAEYIRELADAEIRRQEYAAYVDEAIVLKQQEREITAQLTEAEESLADARQRLTDTGMASTEMQAANSWALIAAQNNVDKLTKLQVENADAQNALNGEIEAYTQAQSEAVTESDRFKSAVNSIKSELEALEAEYNEAYAAAYKSINSQIGLFDLMDVEVKTSIDDMIAALDSQVTYMDTYAENMIKAAEMGVRGGLLTQLSDGSKESAAYLQAIVDGGEEKIAELNEVFGKVEEGKETFSDAYAEMVTDFSARADEIATRAAELSDEFDLTDEMVTSGVNTINGYINGIDNQSGALYAKMQSVANITIAKWNAALDQHSPSRKFKESGKNSMQGYILGIGDKQGEVNAVMERAAILAAASFTAGSKNMTEAQKKVAEELADNAKAVFDEFESYIKDVSDAMQDELDKVQSKIDDVTKQQEDMAKKLADYGDLVDRATISWSDGSSSEIVQLSNLQQQIDTMARYADLLDELEGKNISQSLMMEIVGMDVDDAIEYSQMLLRQSDEQWEKYNEQWEEKQRLAAEIAEKFYKDELDLLEGEYGDKLQESLDVLNEIAYGSGEDVVRGLVDGMKAREAELVAQAQKLASMIENTLKTDLKINSPSKVTMKLGEFTGDGLIIGLENRMDEFYSMIDASIPRNLSAPIAAPVIDNSGVANALNTLSAGMGGSGDLSISFNLNGMEFARATVNDFRAAMAENPVAEVDF